MNGIKNVAEIATYDHTAYIPGSGPKDKTCVSCCSLLEQKNNPERGRCMMWAELKKENWRLYASKEGKNNEGWWKGWNLIEASTPSCKFYVEGKL